MGLSLVCEVVEARIHEKIVSYERRVLLFLLVSLILFYLPTGEAPDRFPTVYFFFFFFLINIANEVKDVDPPHTLLLPNTNDHVRRYRGRKE